MGVQCRLKVVGGGAGDWLDHAYRLAFATSDRRRVDRHFGRADGFAIYAVDAAHSAFLEVIRFEGPQRAGHDEDKLAARIAALAGCAAVYSEAVGASAIFQLKATGVQPIRVPHGVAINDLIEAFQQQLQSGGVERVLATAAPERSAERFDAMAREGWEE